MDANGCQSGTGVDRREEIETPGEGFCAMQGMNWPPFLLPFACSQDKPMDGVAFMPPFDPEIFNKLQEFDWTTFFSSAPYLNGPTQPAISPDSEEGKSDLFPSKPAHKKPPVPDFNIGTLTPSERRVKILRYLEKRRRRSFSKKIFYHCRKRVADSRIRVKGRFVTSAQAAALKDPQPTSSSPSWPWLSAEKVSFHS